MNRRGIVQQVVVLAFEVFVEERDRTGSYRLALSSRSGGRITRCCRIVNHRAFVRKTAMRRGLKLTPECLMGCLGEKGQGRSQPFAKAGAALGTFSDYFLGCSKREDMQLSQVLDCGDRVEGQSQLWMDQGGTD